MIWSLTFHILRHINIEKYTTGFTTDLQIYKFTNIYEKDKLFWELYNRECGEGLTDVKNEVADIERVWFAAAGYRQDSACECCIVQCLVCSSGIQTGQCV
jgi:hypothetical protein